jgi:hypothetical protein
MTTTTQTPASDKTHKCAWCEGDIEWDESSESWTHTETGFTDCPDDDGFHAEPSA